MNCKDVRKYISSLVDNELDIDIEKEVLNHIEECEECKKIYEEEKLIKNLINEIKLEELPKDFEMKLHNKFVDEFKNDKKINKKNIIQLFNKNKKYLAIAAVFIFSIVLINNNPLRMGNDYYAMDEQTKESAMVSDANFGNEDSNKSVRGNDSDGMATLTMTKNMVEAGAPESEPSPMLTSIETKYQIGRIIIRNGNVNLDILDFDKTVDDIKNFVKSYDGYVSNMNSNVRYIDDNGKEFKHGYLEIKIESGSFDVFIEFVKELGKVNGTDFSSQDITNVYRDTVSSIENLEITQDRLRNILEESGTVEETLQIERELTRIRGQIDQLKGNVKNWDRLSQ